MSAGGVASLLATRRFEPQFAAAVEFAPTDLCAGVVIWDLLPNPTPGPLLPKLFAIAERTPHYVVLRPRVPGTLINTRGHHDIKSALNDVRHTIGRSAVFAAFVVRVYAGLDTLPPVVPTPPYIAESAAWPAMSVNDVPWGHETKDGAVKRVRLHFDTHIDARLSIFGIAINPVPAWTVPVLWPHGLPTHLSPNNYVLHVPRHKL